MGRRVVPVDMMAYIRKTRERVEASSSPTSGISHAQTHVHTQSLVACPTPDLGKTLSEISCPDELRARVMAGWSKEILESLALSARL